MQFKSAPHSPRSGAPSTAPRVRGFEVSHSWPDGQALFQDLDFNLSQGRCGLVGPNGAGKTTLFELIAGTRQPSQGTVTVEGRLFYLRQALCRASKGTIADALNISPQLDAFARMEAGDSKTEIFELIGDDWDLADRAKAALISAGLPHPDLSRPLECLSQGELVRVYLARLALDPPDILLLDEPSNHLDRMARAALHEMISSFEGLCLVISHDRELLRLMDTIWELRSGRLRSFGGSYDFYRETRAREDEAAKLRLEHARHELDRREEESRQAERRQLKRIGRGDKEGLSGGMPRILRGALKRKAQVTLAKMQDTHDKRVNQALKAKASAYENASTEARIKIDPLISNFSTGKTILEARDVNIRLPGAEQPLWPRPLNFSLKRGSRMAIEGANGSGKTSLVKCIWNLAHGLDPTPEVTGCLRVASGREARVAMLDQTVSLLETDNTLLGLFTELTPRLPEGERRVILARFLFAGDRVHERLSGLSGGERMRAGLACALMAEPRPSLLILDEPTNNLDLAAIETLEEALKHTSCAILVISHDEDFLAAIGASERIKLERNSP